MKIGVIVLEGPFQHQAADSAFHLVQAALARDHEIVGIFLYTDGVNIANKFSRPPGERNVAARFGQLAERGIPVVACTACAKFRGLRPDVAVERIRFAGLGALAQYLRQADRFVTFGG